MITGASRFQSSTSRPLGLRKRLDLTARRQVYLGRPYWMVKEPLGMTYTRLRDEEYAILQMLDGQASLDDLKQQFDRQFAPRFINYRQLQQFIGMLHRRGLVTTYASGQGGELWKRAKKMRRMKVLAALTNIFAIRWRGVDPERLLNKLLPWTSWFFSRAAVTVNLLVVLSALVLILVQWDVFTARLPAFHEFFGPRNWIWLGLTLAGVKVLHELGHGLSCKRYGCECHEIGFMLLVFTPALYCNVSDSWLLPSKWKRAAIGAAGIYVELCLAAAATFLWWFSAPGLLNFLCLKVMFVCSVSTLLFNGNPLLRFDAYYVLADIVEIPNLRQKAAAVLRRFVFAKCLGVPLPEDAYLPHRMRLFLALYSIAAFIYRWLVILGILLFFNTLLKPYGLQILGRMLGLIGLFGLVVIPVWQGIKFLRVPGRMHEMKKHRALISLAVLAVVVLGVLLIPIPHHVTCSFVVEPRDAATVYVNETGRLDRVWTNPGAQVEANAPLAVLRNPQLELEVLELRRECDELRSEFEKLDKLRYHDDFAVLRQQEIAERLAAAQRQLEEKETRLRQLQVRAPKSGTVVPAGLRAWQAGDDRELRDWTGWALDHKNQGALLQEGEAVCRIGNPSRLEAVLVVDQSDIEFVHPGRRVRIQLESRPAHVLEGKIDSISDSAMEESPASLTNQAGGDVATTTGDDGTPRPLSTSYYARVPLENQDVALRVGLRGEAKISAGSKTVGSRIWRYLMRTFHFEF